MIPAKPWRTAREIIDWSLPSQSIYTRKKPLAENTLKRIQAGLDKYGLKEFIVPHFGERATQSPRTHGLDSPLPAVTSHGAGSIVEPFIVELINNATTRGLNEPLSTVRCSGAHHALCEPIPQQSGGAARPVSQPAPTVATSGAISLITPFLTSYYGNGEALDINKPLDTVTTKERFGLAQPVVSIDGNHYLLDINFRMLQPHELAAAQGFMADHQFEGNKTEAVKQIGNAVPRRLARAICLAALAQTNEIETLLKDKGGADLSF